MDCPNALYQKVTTEGEENKNLWHLSGNAYPVVDGSIYVEPGVIADGPDPAYESSLVVTLELEAPLDCCLSLSSRSCLDAIQARLAFSFSLRSRFLARPLDPSTVSSSVHCLLSCIGGG